MSNNVKSDPKGQTLELDIPLKGVQSGDSFVLLGGQNIKIGQLNIYPYWGNIVDFQEWQGNSYKIEVRKQGEKEFTFINTLKPTK